VLVATVFWFLLWSKKNSKTMNEMRQKTSKTPEATEATEATDILQDIPISVVSFCSAASSADVGFLMMMTSGSSFTTNSFLCHSIKLVFNWPAKPR
jgi:hypothetical protein